MANTEVVKKLEKRKANLTKMIGNCSRDDFTSSARANNIKCYLEELEDLISLVATIDIKIDLVDKSTLEKKCQNADYVSVDDEGYFFQLMLLKNFPHEDIYLLYLAPLNSL